MSPSMTAGSVQVSTRSLYDEMKAIVGAENVSGGGPDRRRKIRTGRGRRQAPRAAALDSFTIEEVVPAIVASPGSAQEIAAILRVASERDLIVVPAGGMTKQTIGAAPERVD